jgi:uncharacterized protein
VEEKKNPFQFPCSYPLKVVGINTTEFYSVVCAIIEKRLEPGSEITYSNRVSTGAKYMSVTATFTVRDHDQLIKIYKDLNEHDLVLVTL